MRIFADREMFQQIVDKSIEKGCWYFYTKLGIFPRIGPCGSALSKGREILETN